MYCFVFITVKVTDHYFFVYFLAYESSYIFPCFGSYRIDHQPFSTDSDRTKITTVAETELEPHHFGGAGAIDLTKCIYNSTGSGSIFDGSGSFQEPYFRKAIDHEREVTGAPFSQGC
jgi:hypothetical protein